MIQAGKERGCRDVATPSFHNTTTNSGGKLLRHSQSTTHRDGNRHLIPNKVGENESQIEEIKKNFACYCIAIRRHYHAP